MNTTVADFTAFEKAGWNRIAGGYHDFLGPLTKRAAGPLVAAAGISSGTRVLDVATGPGYVAGAAHARGATVTGVDIAPEILEIARYANPGPDYRAADAADLPFDDEAFDVVTAGFLVPHLADHVRALGEFRRVLRPGGRLALSTWDVPERVPILGAIVAAVQEVGAPASTGIPQGPPFFKYSAPGALPTLLRDTGFAPGTTSTRTVEAQVSSTDEWWDGVLSGSVRISALVLAAPAEARAAIRTAFERIADGYAAPGGLALPTSILIVTGSR